MTKSAIGLLMLLSSSAAVAQPSCPFSPWMSYRGVAISTNLGRSAYFYATSHKGVDADGAPNAYHPADLGRGCPATGRGLDCPANAGYPTTGWWHSVLAADPRNPARAYVQPSGPFAGYFVSKTSLQNVSAAGPRSPASYVDATRIPYVVMPRPFYEMAGTGRMGDIGYAGTFRTPPAQQRSYSRT